MTVNMQLAVVFYHSPYCIICSTRFFFILSCIECIHVSWCTTVRNKSIIIIIIIIDWQFYISCLKNCGVLSLWHQFHYYSVRYLVRARSWYIGGAFRLSVMRLVFIIMYPEARYTLYICITGSLFHRTRVSTKRWTNKRDSGLETFSACRFSTTKETSWVWPRSWTRRTDRHSLQTTRRLVMCVTNCPYCSYRQRSLELNNLVCVC